MAIALGILAVFLVLALRSIVTADTFAAVFFAAIGMVVGSAVSAAGRRLVAGGLPQPTAEQLLVLILFAFEVVAAIAGLLTEERFLEVSLSLLAYTLGRS